MSTVSLVASSVDYQGVVSVELADAVVEAVLLSPGPRARSAALYSLVSEMCAAVGSLHGEDPTQHGAVNLELVSVGQLAAAAHDHHWRMTYLHTDAAGNGAR